MRVLLVDGTHEGQAQLAERLQAISAQERDALDLSIGLASPEHVAERASSADVLVLGPKAAIDLTSISLAARAANESIQIIVFVTDCEYRAGAFRLVQGNRARKVFSLSSSPFDLLQELSIINDDLRRVGKVSNGTLTVILQPKGGLGVTTIAGALADACAQSKHSAMIWDLDAETRDLTRAFLVAPHHSKVVRSWVDGSAELNRKTLRDALHHTSSLTCVLPPPESLACALDFLSRSESSALASRIVSFARTMVDNIIVDSAGRVGPTVGTLALEADVVLIAVDDSSLGMTATAALYDALRPLLQKVRCLKFLRCGTRVSPEEISAQIFGGMPFDPSAWILPPVPFDPEASRWAGSGKSLFARGSRATRKAFEEIAHGIGLAREGDSAGVGSKFLLAHNNESPAGPDALRLGVVNG